MKILIALPTKNEEENIGFTIDELRKLYHHDIIVVDGNSTDRTREIAKSYGVGVYKQDKPGYGGGIRKAIEIAYNKKYDILATLDCDRTYPPKYLKDLFKHFPKYDLVVGIRPMRNIEFGHRYPNMFLTLTTNILFFTKFKDVNSGMWAMKPDKFYRLIKQNGFDVTVEISTRATKNKYKIKQVPINYLTRVGSSKISVKDGFLILSRIIKERFKP